jgi:hypothetical protein
MYPRLRCAGTRVPVGQIFWLLTHQLREDVKSIFTIRQHMRSSIDGAVA